MKKTSLKNNKGFTIVETLVAISILVLSLTGPLVIISQALKASFYSRDQIAAFYLAQEAVEYIRNIRDETSLSSARPYEEWLIGITGADCQTTNTCVNDYTDSVPLYKFNLSHAGQGYTFEPCDPEGCAPLTYSGDVSNIPYGGSSVDASKFTRTIWLTNTPGTDNVRKIGEDASTEPEAVPLREVMVHVEVTWKQGTADNKFVLESHLLNWKLEK